MEANPENETNDMQQKKKKLIQQTNGRSRTEVKNEPQEKGEKRVRLGTTDSRWETWGKNNSWNHRQYIRLPAHKVPRRSEQVSHEKDMFRVKYGAEISPTFRREH